MDKKILEQLFASGVFTDESKAAITTAFSEAIEGAKNDARAEVVAEFKKNKAKMYETVEKYIEGKIAGPIKTLREEAEQVATLKGQYADKLVGVEESVKEEFSRRWKQLVETLSKVVEREIGELHESEKLNRRAYLRKMNEMETKLAKEREQFKTKAAMVLENILDIKVQKHLDEHEADLRAAMKSDFGTEIFEAFFSTFQRHFFSTNGEARKLAEALKKAEAEKTRITEQAQQRIALAETKARRAEAAHAKVVESHARTAEMAKLLAPLKGAARDRMKALLEAAPSVATMQKTYKRFLPEVMSESAPLAPVAKTAQAIDLKTGGALTQPVVKESVETGDDDELVDLRRRSGVAR